MGDDDKETLTEKAYRKIILGLILGGLSIGGVSLTGVTRIDKFTAHDGDTLRASLLAAMHLQRQEVIREIQSGIAIQERECEKDKDEIRRRLTVMESEHAILMRTVVPMRINQ